MAKIDLDEDQCRTAGQALIAEEVSVSTKKSFLAGLHEKGERPAEVAGFARFFRELALNPGLDAYASDAIDVVGTGGDRSGSFNVSTASSFILAEFGHTSIQTRKPLHYFAFRQRGCAGGIGYPVECGA